MLAFRNSSHMDRHILHLRELGAWRNRRQGGQSLALDTSGNIFVYPVSPFDTPEAVVAATVRVGFSTWLYSLCA